MLVYNPWKILHLKMMHPSLVVAVSLIHFYWETRILLQLLPLISLQKGKNKKNRRLPSVRRQRTINVGVPSLYHRVFITFWHHNAMSYNYE
jgi:hypothetical protein